MKMLPLEYYYYYYDSFDDIAVVVVIVVVFELFELLFDEKLEVQYYQEIKVVDRIFELSNDNENEEVDDEIEIEMIDDEK